MLWHSRCTRPTIRSAGSGTLFKCFLMAFTELSSTTSPPVFHLFSVMVPGFAFSVSPPFTAFFLLYDAID
ncbi:unnamed protein product [Thelazia callipaeda]|uniref:Secreted protein n=1 Tax=Thelazia callipaeda TaxID=103827 RepID=A0A0N5CJ16_THECL|nr:unnamed protein product [Thelazia callipaeda]